jgi:ribosomal protein S18 acetylase RimI-like enzyme
MSADPKREEIQQIATDAIEILIIREGDLKGIAELYRSGGWWKEQWETSGIARIITGSFAFAVAIERSTMKTVGMGRVISDGVSDAYIQDLVVLPAYQKRGIGRRILGALITYCNAHDIRWIALIAEPGTQDFYHVSGFVGMEGYIPMKYRSAGGE